MDTPAAPEPRKLAIATAIAALVAGIVLVVAVLPAEYGIDPTGLGAVTGFARLAPDSAGGEDVDIIEESLDTRHAIDVRWRVTSFPVATQTGYIDGPSGETFVRIPLQLTNVSSVTAELRWNDSDLIDGEPTAPDTFSIGIRAPQGKTSHVVRGDNTPGGEGHIVTGLAWRSIPSPTWADGALVMHLHEPDTTSHGNWTFVVRLESARGLPDDARRDPGNGWTLVVTADVYELVVQERESEGGDRVTLTLGPDHAFEYKFHMRPGAPLHYAWTSTSAIYWDLHAEEDGKDPDDFLAIRTGTSASDEGEITATFSGRHGWFFHNRGNESVTLTLETSGDYRILGVV